MKNILFILLSAIFLTSCNNSSIKISADPGKNERLVRKYFEHFNKHEWSELAGMYADSANFKDPSFGIESVNQSKKQIVDKYNDLVKLMPDLKDEIINLYPSGDNHIIVEFISTGTAPDKSKMRLPICTIFKIKGDLITEDFTYYDNFEE